MNIRPGDLVVPDALGALGWPLGDDKRVSIVRRGEALVAPNAMLVVACPARNNTLLIVVYDGCLYECYGEHFEALT